MHSKRKGNIGQFATALALSKLGYSVFTEEGDISKIDIIAEKNGVTLRFQCKAITPKNGKIELPLRKCGPGYSEVYQEHMIDYFSLYDLESQNLYLVSSDILQRCNNAFALRLDPPKNNQLKGVTFAKDFLFENVLTI